MPGRGLAEKQQVFLITGYAGGGWPLGKRQWLTWTLQFWTPSTCQSAIWGVAGLSCHGLCLVFPTAELESPPLTRTEGSWNPCAW